MKKIFLMFFGVMLLCAIPLMASATSYLVIGGTGAITWAQARALALALPGDWDLASITSAAEQADVDAALAAADPTPANRHEYWIGGFFDSSTWKWVSGETFSFTNWWGGEPNNVAGIEAQLAEDWRDPGFVGNSGTVGAWKWNDEGSAPQQIVGYVAESVPEPSTLLFLGCGLIGLAGFARKKFRK